jgi:hypothetical protein
MHLSPKAAYGILETSYKRGTYMIYVQFTNKWQDTHSDFVSTQGIAEKELMAGSQIHTQDTLLSVPTEKSI